MHLFRDHLAVIEGKTEPLESVGGKVELSFGPFEIKTVVIRTRAAVPGVEDTFRGTSFLGDGSDDHKSYRFCFG